MASPGGRYDSRGWQNLSARLRACPLRRSLE